MTRRLPLLLLVPVLLAGCSKPVTLAQQARTSGLAAAEAGIPSDPKARAEVELGFRLFFEPRLSDGNKMTCAHCHLPNTGFSNGERTAAGVTGARGKRNVPTIYATGRSWFQFWDGRAVGLEEQALGPIQNPIEMNAKLEDVVAKLDKVPYYQAKFRAVYGRDADPKAIAKALAAFERALEPDKSAFDKWRWGEQDAMTEQQLRGMAIFDGKGDCRRCHVGPDFTDGSFHTLGVGLGKPDPDLGRFVVEPEPKNYGAFKTPTLRNVAKTAPYMHDGSIDTLEAVVDLYDRGGDKHPHGLKELNPLGLSGTEKQDLVAFLRALSAPDNLKAIGRLPGVH